MPRPPVVGVPPDALAPAVVAGVPAVLELPPLAGAPPLPAGSSVEEQAAAPSSVTKSGSVTVFVAIERMVLASVANRDFAPRAGATPPVSVGSL